jgi:hypothetical protein
VDDLGVHADAGVTRITFAGLVVRVVLRPRHGAGAFELGSGHLVQLAGRDARDGRRAHPLEDVVRQLPGPAHHLDLSAGLQDVHGDENAE